MRRQVVLGMMICLLTGAAQAGSARKDEDVLQGGWQVVSSTFNGKDQAKAVVKDRQLVFRGREFTVMVAGKAQRSIAFTLDPSSKPGRIDLTLKGKDQTALGLYRLEGDRLELCYGEPGAERPTAFASEAGSRVFLMVLRRVKK